MTDFASPFRTEQNVRLLQRLFWEMTPDKSRAMYTLKETPHHNLPSFYQLYLEMADITEYEFATTYLDGVEHWEMLCEATWFKPHLYKMRRHLELKLKAEQVHVLMRDAKDPESKSATASAKYLLDKGFRAAEPDQRKVGRPSRRDIANAATELAVHASDIHDDFERISAIREPSNPGTVQ